MPYANNGGYNNNSRSNYTPRFNNGGGNRTAGGTSFQNRQSSGGASASDDNVRSNGFQLVNEKAGKFLNIAYWNKCLNLEIGTFTPGAYDFNVAKNAAKLGQFITYAGIHELMNLCEDILDSIKATGTFTNAAIEVGSKKDCMVEISNGRSINKPAGIYLVIYKGLDTGKRTNTLDFYPFGATKVILDYDHNTGSGREDIKPSGDFKKFCTAVSEAAKACTMAQAHAIQEIRKGDKLATFMALSSIGAALGVDFGKQAEAASKPRSNYSGNRSGGGSSGTRSYTSGRFNGNGASYNNTNYSSQVAPPDDPVDIQLDASALSNIDISQFN